MTSLLTTELEARVRMGEREREIRRIERWSWQEQPRKRGAQLPIRIHAVRHCVGALVVRLGVWIAGAEDAHSRDSGEGPHQRHDNRNLLDTYLERGSGRSLRPPFREPRNPRAARGGTGVRGRRRGPISVIEPSPAEAAPVFKEPLASLPALDKGYLDATPDPPLPAFEREAPSYPTFRVVAAASPTVR